MSSSSEHRYNLETKRNQSLQLLHAHWHTLSQLSLTGVPMPYTNNPFFSVTEHTRQYTCKRQVNKHMATNTFFVYFPHPVYGDCYWNDEFEESCGPRLEHLIWKICPNILLRSFAFQTLSIRKKKSKIFDKRSLVTFEIQFLPQQRNRASQLDDRYQHK